MTTKPLLRVLALACFLTTRSVSIEAGQLTNYTSSWFGNTFGGGSGWVQQEIAGIYVTTNGIVYANVYWDEGGGNFSAYQNGALIATGLHCHGWGRNGGNAVCVNSNYVFFSQRADNEGGALVDSNTNTDSWPPVGYNWYGVTRRLRSNITQGAPFAGGKGGSGDTLANSYLVVNQVPTSYSGGDIQGLYATDTRLYVSCPYDGYIRVYDANSMVFLWSFAVSNPGSLTMDANGKLWLVEQGTNRVDRYNTNGTLEATLTLPAGAVPSGISVDSQNRLFIADDGTNEQVLIYTNLAGSPNLSGTFGTTGGIYSGIRGATGPLKFHNIAGAGADGAGNIYVCSTRGVGNHTTSGSNNGGTILESYTPAGARNWQLFGLLFVHAGMVDPRDETEVYTTDTHYSMDYSQPAGQQWTCQGFTLDHFTYPKDPRAQTISFQQGFGSTAFVQWINGTKFLFTCEQPDVLPICVYRFTTNEIIVPCAVINGGSVSTTVAGSGWPPNSPASGEWIWTDSNGNGQFDAGEFQSNGTSNAPDQRGMCMDANGNIWVACIGNGIREYILQGVTNGIPQYSYSGLQTIGCPAPFTQVLHIRYDAAADVMYLEGANATYPLYQSQWWLGGQIICRYNNWSAGNRTPAWQIIAPASSSDGGGQPFDMDTAGSYLFLAYDGSSGGLGIQTGHVEVFQLSDGADVGWMEPDPTTIGQIGDQDTRESIHAFQRANGQYVVIIEDDNRAKNVMYLWCPSGNCPEGGPPPAPTGLTATAGNAQATLNWNASSVATTYNVYRSTTNGGPYAVIATNITTTSYTNTGLANGTNYYYVVTVVNGSGESGYSNQASATPTSNPPPAPSGLTAAASYGQVSLSWTASAGATSYNVYRSTTNGGPYTQITSGVTTTNYTDTGLSNGTTYYYVVTAVNVIGESGYSNQAGATSTGGGASLPISFVRAAQSTNVSGGTSVSVTMANNAGDTLVVAVRMGNAGAQVIVPSNVTDTSGNTYTLVNYANQGSGNDRGSAFFVAQNVPASTANTITFNTSDDPGYWGAINSQAIAVEEFANVSRVETNGTATTGYTQTATISSGLLTTTNSGDLLVFETDSQGTGSSWTAGTGYTIPANGQNLYQAMEYFVAGAGGVYSTSVTYNSAGGSLDGVYAALSPRTALPPSPLSFTYSGNQLSLSWSNGSGILLTSTNVALPMTNWVPVTTNPTMPYVITIGNGVPQMFFRAR